MESTTTLLQTHRTDPTRLPDTPMKIALLAASLLAFAGLTGCASLTNNVTQPVVVSTTCGEQPLQGASCRIINSHGSWTVQSTPGSVMIRKSPSDMAIDCKLPQAQAMPVVAESHTTLGTYGNILIGGLVGFGVDIYRDAAWKYDTEISIDMCKGVPARMSGALQSSTAVATVPANGSPLANMQTVVATDTMKYAFSAEAMAKQRQCSANPTAVLNARGPATEVYTVACNNGDALMLKCTYGECKAI